MTESEPSYPQQVWNHAFLRFLVILTRNPYWHLANGNLELEGEYIDQCFVSVVWRGDMCDIDQQALQHLSSNLASKMMFYNFNCFVSPKMSNPQRVIPKLKILSKRCEGYTTYESGTDTHLAREPSTSWVKLSLKTVYIFPKLGHDS